MMTMNEVLTCHILCTLAFKDITHLIFKNTESHLILLSISISNHFTTMWYFSLPGIH